MVNTKIRLIIFFAAKDGEALYSQPKQDWELTVAQIMNSLLPNSDLNKKVGKTTRPIRYDINQIPYDYTLGNPRDCGAWCAAVYEVTESDTTEET